MKKKWIIILSLIILLLIIFILFLLFNREKSFTITFNTDGGTVITDIKVLNDEIVKLPESPTKDGYTFIGWTDSNGNIVTPGTKFTKDTTLTAKWVSNDAETITAVFDTDGGNKINDILIEKGTIILLPVEPIKGGYLFIAWLDENGNFISNNMIVSNNITLKAYWIKKDAKTWTISFDTDGGSSINNIVIEDGKTIILPNSPTKSGYVFAGWIDENGNLISEDTIINSKITLKATWKEPYTCPSDCTPIEDGSKCSKEITTSVSTTPSCPSGYSLKNGICIGTRYPAKSIDTYPWWACNSSSDYMYDEIDESGFGAMMWCQPRVNPTTKQGCPSGYTQNGNICQKTEIINCQAN